jgi:hypothetical protein
MVSADILYSEPNQDERNQTDEAMEWLQDFLGDSEIDSKVAKQKAGDAGISEKASRRAREKLDVRVIRRGKGKEHVTTWLLAPHTPTDAPLNVGMSSVNGHEWPSQGELSPNWPESPLGTNTWSR